MLQSKRAWVQFMVTNSETTFRFCQHFLAFAQLLVCIQFLFSSSTFGLYLQCFGNSILFLYSVLVLAQLYVCSPHLSCRYSGLS